MTRSYLVLLENMDIEPIPEMRPTYGSSNSDGVVILPSEPISAISKAALSEVISECFWGKCEHDHSKLMEKLPEEERESIYGDPMPPPEWMIAIGIWLFNAIAGGATWDGIKESAKRVIRKIRDSREEELEELDETLSNEQIDMISVSYLRKDFSDEDTVHEFYQLLERLYEERGQEFDLNRNSDLMQNELERAKEILEGVVTARNQEQERLNAQRRFRIEFIETLLEDIIATDSDGAAHRSEAIGLCFEIDNYLLNGIESQFLRPAGDPVKKAVADTLEIIKIPDEVMLNFRRFNILCLTSITLSGRRQLKWPVGELV